MMVVEKYGGTSVNSLDKLDKIAAHIKEERLKGKKMLVVVSAKAHVTDELIHKANMVYPEASGRELDALLSTGEIETATLLTMKLISINIPALSLNAWQIPILSSPSFQDGKIIKINVEKIKQELDQNRVVIVPGFQAINQANEVVTLGRGGSDTIAVSLAGIFKVPCYIYTDVDGVYTCDPKITPSAKHLKTISYDEMIEFASSGSKVLASRAALLAKKLNVTVIIKRLGGDKMTILVDEPLEDLIITGLVTQSIKKGYLRNTDLTNFLNACQNASLVLEKMTYLYHYWHLYYRTQDDKKMNIIKKNISIIEDEKTYCILSLIGTGLKSHYQVISEVYQILTVSLINIYDITTSELKITLIIDEDKREEASKLIINHFKLEGDDKYQTNDE